MPEPISFLVTLLPLDRQKFLQLAGDDGDGDMVLDGHGDMVLDGSADGLGDGDVDGDGDCDGYVDGDGFAQ